MNIRWRVAAALCATALSPARAEQTQSVQPPASANSDERFRMAESVSPEAARLMQQVFAASRSWFLDALKVTDPKTVETMARALPKVPDSALAMSASRYGVTARMDKLGGVPVVRIQAMGGASRGIIVGLHGGGYISGSAEGVGPTDAQFAKSGYEVVSIDYTLAPYSKWQQTTDEVVAVWKALLASGVKPQSVAFAGASAGGGLAAGSLLKARDQGLPMPAAVILMSPWADLTTTGDSFRTLANYEPLFPPSWVPMTASLYADLADQKNPYASPVFGDYSKGYPPTLIQGGTREILLSGFVRQYQAIRTGGREAVLDLYEGMPHCFQDLIADAPEARAARQVIMDFVQQYVKS